MKTFFYLGTCNTCKRILQQLDLPTDFNKQEIKSEPLRVAQLDELASMAGSYEALFSKRAKLYKERGLMHEDLTEDDFRMMILEHYTFLKRPVLVNGDEIFIGNSKKTVEAAIASLR